MPNSEAADGIGEPVGVEDDLRGKDAKATVKALAKADPRAAPKKAKKKKVVRKKGFG